LSTWFPPVPGRKSRVAGIISYLKAHPLLCLLILSPGIPEYLSGSSNMAFLVVNPVVFFLFLAANLALYGPGVILIREAKIRWNKGWASVFLLGAAYGIVEEGLALRTLFNPNSSVVGNLGVYGHALGVNWVWAVGLVIFHSVFSIGLPIFIFGLAFPELKSKSLVSSRGISIALFTLGVDSFLLSLLVNYWPAEIWGLLVISSIVVAILVVAARKLPSDFLKSVRRQPGRVCKPVSAYHNDLRCRRRSLDPATRIHGNGNPAEPGSQSRICLRARLTHSRVRAYRKRLISNGHHQRCSRCSFLEQDVEEMESMDLFTTLLPNANTSKARQ